MPTNDSPERLDWDETNLERVISDLYREIENDENLRQRLMSAPFEVLSERISVPESYRGRIFVSEKGQDAMMLYPPARNVAAREALPEGTSEAPAQQNFELLCTTILPW